ncbi:KGG domain-containing protein [Rhodoferax sp. WC2427]|uniref:KGG domain-containing protein n=1 Tax=Rhodoferax sp. WC2427 TaxID=3234144 RepID=UPI00346528FC
MASTYQNDDNRGSRGNQQGKNDGDNRGTNTPKDPKQGSSQQGTQGRGFASMDPDKQREIASEGGKAAHSSGNAHEFTSQEARAAGSKSHGGKSTDDDNDSNEKSRSGGNKSSQTSQSSHSSSGSRSK